MIKMNTSLLERLIVLRRRNKENKFVVSYVHYDNNGDLAFGDIIVSERKSRLSKMDIDHVREFISKEYNVRYKSVAIISVSNI